MASSKSTQIIIAPSLLAADITKVSLEVAEVESGGADWLHVDVMDGSFVPPITFGDNVVRGLKKQTKLFLDVHLMVHSPERQFELFHNAGADRLIIHQETCPHLYRSLAEIRSLGMKNGVAVNPGTPVETIFDVLDVCDLVLIMTVNPGWGGQSFIPAMASKILTLKDQCEKLGLAPLIEVDGGITAKTLPVCRSAGATVFVAGSSVFGVKDRTQAISELRQA